MVPVLVWLVLVVPGFKRNSRADTDHIIPTAVVRLGQHMQSIFGIIRFIEGVHQELRAIDAASHPAGLDKIDDILLLSGRNQIERQREHIAM